MSTSKETKGGNKTLSSGSSDASAKKLSPEEIIRGFQQLREEQRATLNKVGELEAERKEHKLVIETLEKVDNNRRCFRLLGGVLVERTVKDVLPTLCKNEAQISNLLETLKEQLSAKNKELCDYREKHGIRFVRESELQQASTASKAAPASEAVASTANGALVEST